MTSTSGRVMFIDDGAKELLADPGQRQAAGGALVTATRPVVGPPARTHARAAR
jgi:hypothetical protein